MGQWGTYMSIRRRTSMKGCRTVDQIPPKDMVLPLVVDRCCTPKVEANPDYTLTPDDVSMHGNPARSCSGACIRRDAH